MRKAREHVSGVCTFFPRVRAVQIQQCKAQEQTPTTCVPSQEFVCRHVQTKGILALQVSTIEDLILAFGYKVILSHAAFQMLYSSLPKQVGSNPTFVRSQFVADLGQTWARKNSTCCLKGNMKEIQQETRGVKGSTL